MEIENRKLLGRWFCGLSFALLVACLAARPYLGEMPFRVSQLRIPVETQGSNEDIFDSDGSANRLELAGLTFSVVILAALACWLIGSAIAGGLKVRYGYIGWGIAVFAVLSLVSALRASDRRTALDMWIVQVTLPAAGFLAMQLCSDKKRFAVIVLILAAIGISLSVEGLWQYFEAPYRAENFELYRNEHLSVMGWQAGSVQARNLESRMRDPAPLGYFGLANVFGSMMIVLAAAAVGLAIDKFSAAIRSRPGWKKVRRKDEIHLPSLAAILTASGAAGAVVVIFLTRSRGAIVSVCVTAGAAVVIFRFRRTLARHWRRCVIIAAGAVIVLSAAVTGYGLSRDRLPTKTMTFRWFYWTASAEIIRDNPLLGVGPGNFSSTYLAYRRPQAEEAVKTPHNVVMHALTQYGLAGGLAYLGIIACVLVGLCRKSKTGGELQTRPRNRFVFLVIVAAAAMFVTRVFLADSLGSPMLFTIKAVVPTVILGLGILLACWAGNGSALTMPMPATRFLIVCALGGFVLHNTVTFSMWMPGAAVVFWVAAGACLANRHPIAAGAPRKWAFIFSALIATAATAAAVIVLWMPVFNRTRLIESACAAMTQGHDERAQGLAIRSAQADVLDARAAADAARMILAHGQAEDRLIAYARLGRAYSWAKEAMRRDESDSGYPRLAGRIAMDMVMLHRPGPIKIDDAIKMTELSVKMDKQDSHLRLEYAHMLAKARRMQQCLEQVHLAEETNRLLLPKSSYKFSPSQRNLIRHLKRRAGEKR